MLYTMHLKTVVTALHTVPVSALCPPPLSRAPLAPYLLHLLTDGLTHLLLVVLRRWWCLLLPTVLLLVLLAAVLLVLP